MTWCCGFWFDCCEFWLFYFVGLFALDCCFPICLFELGGGVALAFLVLLLVAGLCAYGCRVCWLTLTY